MAHTILTSFLPLDFLFSHVELFSRKIWEKCSTALLTARLTTSAVQSMDGYNKEGPVLTEHRIPDALSSD